jgi:hypothetical protein
MRSYGIVRSKFWAWAKERGLGPAARELALYTLTCEHVNGTGCYRLPVAYIAEDLGTVAETVRKTVAELAKVGFLRHDDATGYVWLPGFLDHNPIPNGNVGKALVPFVEAVPRRVPFYADFIASLECANAQGKSGERRFPDGFLDRMRNGMPNGSGNGMPTHEHEREHEHEHERKHDAGAGGDAPKADDVREAFNAWNAAASRTNGRWPVANKLTDKRRSRIRARLKDAGGLDGFLTVLAKAEAADFVRNKWKSFGLDKLLLDDNWQKISDGNYDDGRAPAEPGRVDTLNSVADMYRARESDPAWRGVEQ